MNAALKYNENVRTSGPAIAPVEGSATHEGQWLKVLCTVLFFAAFGTAVALASVWMKLEIDRKYQKIDEIKIQNSRLRNEINRLDAAAAQLRSLERVQADLAAAGVVMEIPRAAFFLDQTNGSGYVAFSKDGEDGRI